MGSDRLKVGNMVVADAGSAGGIVTLGITRDSKSLASGFLEAASGIILEHADISI